MDNFNLNDFHFKKSIVDNRTSKLQKTAETERTFYSREKSSSDEEVIIGSPKSMSEEEEEANELSCIELDD
jgi:hypothetical protein